MCYICKHGDCSLVCYRLRQEQFSGKYSSIKTIKKMKSLIKLFGLMVMVGMFSACSNDGDSESLDIPKYMSEKKSTEVRFIKNVKTRACDVNGNMWTTMPATVSAQEAAEVLAYIATDPDYCDELPEYTRYFIQHVGGAGNEYSYRDHNGAEHKGINGTTGLNNLQILENSGWWIHVNNFNAGKCDNPATNNSALMTDGFNGIKAMASYSGSWVESYRIYYYKGSYYIGLDFYMIKGDGQVPADGIYDDWVLKIVPEGISDDNGDSGDNGDDNGDNGDSGDDNGDNGDDNGDSGDDTGDSNDPVPAPVIFGKGEVEFDIHQQEHTDWNEIKTTVHLRDSVNVRILIPVPGEYIAVPDDFDIRSGMDYTYICEKEVVKYTVAGQEFETEVLINHTAEGIEILIEGTQCKEALKVARAVYADGLTFEIHSYIYREVDDEAIWGWLKTTECAQTSYSRWPVSGDCCTHTYGQVTSAYYPEEGIEYDKNVE